MPSPLSDADLLARLVAVDTTSSRSNLPLAELLADYLDGTGADVRLLPSADGAKANLLVRFGPRSTGDGDDEHRPGLVLSGHMDVVPAGDGWSSDPFRLTDRGDGWVGRGSADMKGFLALAANVARETAPAPLAAPLCLLFTYDEEVGTLGAQHLVEDWPDTLASTGPLPRATVIGEPTSLRAVRLHKGHLKLRFAFAGRSAHSGYPHLGLNAIEAAGRAVVALSHLRRELEAERTAASVHFPQVPFSALNVGVVHGGAAVNVVPERCVVEVGVRVLPGQDSAELARRVEEAVARAAGESEPRVPAAAELLSDSPPLDAPADAPIHRHLCQALHQDADASVAFATDAGWLQRLGLDCVVWGPGSIEVAHKPDEWVPKADLVAARRHLEELVQRFCVHPEAA